jgi:hypothetical protein
MKEWLASRLVNAFLVLITLAIGFLFFELVVFRFVLLPSDVPSNAFVNDLVRYAPNQSGTWRVRDEIAAPYFINAQGWNSGIGDYVVERRPAVRRIAIVGDSMVEAMQVAYDHSMAERLSKEMGSRGVSVEVYRFGIAGAPLTQYLWMVEREVLAYRPDAIVVLLIHNDFDESFRFVQGRYTSSFAKLRVSDGKVLGEIPPTPWEPTAADWIRRSASARYMYYRWQVRLEPIRELLLGPAAAQSAKYEANIDVRSALGRLRDIEATTDHVFGRLAEMGRRTGVRLLIAIDGVRFAIYQGERSEVLLLNRLAGELAQKHGLTFLDLHSAFGADWAANHKRFEFQSDGHWNEHGHAVAARAVAEGLK